MPNSTILGVSHSPLFLEMVKIWPFYGQKMVLTRFFKLVLLIYLLSNLNLNNLFPILMMSAKWPENVAQGI